MQYQNKSKLPVLQLPVGIFDEQLFILSSLIVAWSSKRNFSAYLSANYCEMQSQLLWEVN